MTLRTMTEKLLRLEALARRRNDRNTEGEPVVQWSPFPDKDGRPSPQRLAYDSLADELFLAAVPAAAKPIC